MIPIDFSKVSPDNILRDYPGLPYPLLLAGYGF